MNFRKSFLARVSVLSNRAQVLSMAIHGAASLDGTAREALSNEASAVSKEIAALAGLYSDFSVDEHADCSSALNRAVALAGGSSAVAGEIGDITRQAVEQWVVKGRVPAIRVLDLERISGVSRHELRPDLYPLEEEG